MVDAAPAVEKLESASFRPKSGPNKGKPVTVHFNPASLQYTIANTLKDEGNGNQKKQYVSQTTGKLTMDLVFDSTDTGADVRGITDRMAQLMQPYQDGGGKVPPVVEFGWGVYRFTGMVEQYKETIDFFAPGGVPLRSSINLTLSSQDVVFDNNKDPSIPVDTGLSPAPVVTRSGTGPAGGAAGIAGALGDPRSARGIAGLNAAASLRFGSGGELAIGGSVTLSPAAAFSTGVSAGAGIGIGGAASAGAGLSLGGGASAGATLGAFAGLRVGTQAAATMPEPAALLTAGGSVGPVGAGAQFGLGGRLQTQGSAGLGADAGGVRARLSFDT
ncbi:MAG: hypothetical protein NVS9B10_15570 [Nevskia sp.]